MPVTISTAAEVAAELGTTSRTIQRHAQSLGWQKTAGVWLFSQAQVRELRRLVRASAGNPNAGKPWFGACRLG